MFSGQRPFDITKNPKFRYAYRALGLVTLGILLIIISGNDPYLSVKNYIINFPDHWVTFVNQCSAVWSWITNHAQLTWNWISEHAPLTWNWISEHAVISSNWIVDHINSGWRVVKDQWLPAMKVK